MWPPSAIPSYRKAKESDDHPLLIPKKKKTQNLNFLILKKNHKARHLMLLPDNCLKINHGYINI
jgi:hypothetical protein